MQVGVFGIKVTSWDSTHFYQFFLCWALHIWHIKCMLFTSTNFARQLHNWVVAHWYNSEPCRTNQPVFGRTNLSQTYITQCSAVQHISTLDVKWLYNNFWQFWMEWVEWLFIDKSNLLDYELLFRSDLDWPLGVKICSNLIVNKIC